MAEEEKNPIAPSNIPPEDTSREPERATQNKDEINKAMKKMAERAPEEFFEMTAMMGGPMMGHPLHHKMNEDHITKMLDLAVQHDTNEYDLRKNQQGIDAKHSLFDRISHAFYFVVFVGLIVFILWVFRSQPTVLVPIIAGVGGVVTGFLGGFGYAKGTLHTKKK